MRARSAGYSLYMVLSIMISLTVAAIPAILLFAFVIQNVTGFLNNLGWPFITIFEMVSPYLTSTKLSRRGIPFLEDGYYESDTGDWLLYEYFEIYYVIFPYFAWFFSVYFDTKPRHQAFGAKIGKNTIVGNGRLFNPERTIIGDNCFFGYNAIVTGHVYESGKLYLKTVKLGNNVIIGANAVVLPGADIGDNVIVGANTVVPKNTTIPPNTIWVNGKAKVRKPKVEKLHNPEDEARE